MFIDEKNCLSKNEKELETLTYAMRIYSENIWMEYDIEKCIMIIIQSGNREMTKRNRTTKSRRIRTLGEKENYKYLGKLEADTIKYAEVKEKN